MIPKALVFLILAGCAHPTITAQVLQPVDTNTAQLGTAVGIAEADSRVLILERDRATLIRSGVAISIPSSRRWRSAGAIPAADGAGTWLVAIDEAGDLYRLRDNAFEAVSDRYGLRHIHTACSPKPEMTAFLLDDEVAVTDGARVTRWPLRLTDLVCGGGRIAGRAPHRVIVFDPVTAAVRPYTIDAVGLGLDDTGRLYAATKHALYVANDAQTLDRRYMGHIRSLAVAGTHAWLSDGETLVSIDQSELRGSPLADPTATLHAVTNGDLWLLGQHPMRLTQRHASTPAPTMAWAHTVAPIFARACAACHLPNGRAGVDLSTAPAWQSRRDLLHQRLQVDHDMPPKGHALSDEDRATLARWLASGT